MSGSTRVRAIASAAATIPHSERAAWLAEACGSDAALLEAVQRELDQRTAAGSTAEEALGEGLHQTSGEIELGEPDRTITSAPGIPATGAGSQLASGALIAGRYRLVRILGEGGMGSVWLADQLEPVRRMVAVKLIRTGADSSQVIARFEAERQALAVMDHPNIARILDGGTVEGPGLPFFVMELVQGVPINRYCDQNRLSIRQRLELFIPVCDAIQHAHQKGIIHRDLKPSNILVAADDGRSTPKVIDFGVAKAIGQSLTDRTLDTAIGAIVGTPQYMSPEQASPGAIDIDTRTDVYSLGVVLYELLTGSLPFDRKRLGRAAIYEILRIIREEEPSTPSSKLSTDEGLVSISENRNTEPGRLARSIRGELDWIVMKSLEKDRTRRYDSASGLAADVRRFLTGEPVVAAPPSRWYRFRKFVRRNRGPVVAAGLVAGSLIAGIVGTGIGLRNAQIERNKANTAREAESAQRQQAEAATQQAFLALQSFTDEFVERQFASRTILTPNDRDILRKALVQWERFAATQGDSLQARQIRAEGHYRVANLRTRLGETADAADSYRQAVELMESLIASAPDDPAILRQSVETRIACAAQLRLDRQPGPALEQLEKALPEIERAIRLRPGDQDLARAEATVNSATGVVLRASGRKSDAYRAYDRCQSILEGLVRAAPDDLESRQRLAVLHNNLGNLLVEDGDTERARTHYLAGLALRRELAERNPADPEYTDDLANSHYGLGDLYRRLNDNERSLAEYREALRLLTGLNQAFPLIPEYRLAIAGLHQNISAVLDRSGSPEETWQSINASIGILEQLSRDFPDNIEFRQSLARQISLRGKERLQTGDVESASADLDQAVAALERLEGDHPEIPAIRIDLARAFQNRAMLEVARRNPAGIRTLHGKSLALLEQLNAGNPDGLLYRIRLVEAHWSFAGQLLEAGDLGGAEEEYRKAIGLKQPLVEEFPGVPEHGIELARMTMSLGAVLSQRKQPAPARDQYLVAIRILESLANADPASIPRSLELAGGLTNLSFIQKDLQEPGAAMESLQRARGIFESVRERDPKRPDLLIAWGGNLVNRSDLLRDLGDGAAAQAALDEAITELRQVVERFPNEGQARAFLHTALLRRAGVHDAAGEFALAAADWEALAGLGTPDEAITYRSKTAQSLVRAGETARAVEIAESLASVRMAPTMFARARVHALAFGKDGDETQALRSIAILKQLVRMGLNDIERLKSDPDLASLQEREDFLELLRSIRVR